LLSRFTVELGVACFTGLIGAIVCYGSLEFGTGWGDAGPEPGYFPFYVGLIIILASAFNFGAAVVRRRRELAEVFLSVEQGRRVFSFFGPMFLFVLVSSFLGIYVGIVLYLFGVMVFQGGYRLPKAAAISLLTAVINYLLFEVWFQVPLLKGPVEAFLGLH
ncbi:MAG: tripartite tricarboxylate transporter TctB family protein, partial [Candidatus Accumulibacter sp.]|jgi:hypothetical protein|nr:tripartite tricarboxylate transporter TctB family protein [Accumulibacter sp.]